MHQVVYKIIAIAIFKKSQIITIIRMNVYFFKFYLYLYSNTTHYIYTKVIDVSRYYLYWNKYYIEIIILCLLSMRENKNLINKKILLIILYYYGHDDVLWTKLKDTDPK